MSPNDLCYFNFRTRIPREINWYLYNKVGCRHATPNGNYMFSQADQPGVVYIPLFMTRATAPRFSGLRGRSSTRRTMPDMLAPARRPARAGGLVDRQGAGVPSSIKSRNVYIAVLVYLAALICVFYLFTRAYS
jgi:hypothetical protein